MYLNPIQQLLFIHNKPLAYTLKLAVDKCLKPKTKKKMKLADKTTLDKISLEADSAPLLPLIYSDCCHIFRTTFQAIV